MSGSTSKMGSPSDVKFVDPSGLYAKGLNSLESIYGQNADQTQQSASAALAYDPNAYMSQFFGQAPGLSNMVSGQISPLQQSLNAIATREAALGSEAALASIPGAANSGAGMAAFGQAYADPFARASAQLQNDQLQGTLGLWNTALGLNAQNQQFNAQNRANIANVFGGLAGQALQGYGSLSGGAGGLWQPTYQKNPSFWQNAAGAGTAIAGLASVFK